MTFKKETPHSHVDGVPLNELEYQIMRLNAMALNVPHIVGELNDYDFDTAVNKPINEYKVKNTLKELCRKFSLDNPARRYNQNVRLATIYTGTEGGGLIYRHLEGAHKYKFGSDGHITYNQKAKLKTVKALNYINTLWFFLPKGEHEERKKKTGIKFLFTKGSGLDSIQPDSEIIRHNTELIQWCTRFTPPVPKDVELEFSRRCIIPKDWLRDKESLHQYWKNNPDIANHLKNQKGRCFIVQDCNPLKSFRMYLRFPGEYCVTDLKISVLTPDYRQLVGGRDFFDIEALPSLDEAIRISVKNRQDTKLVKCYVCVSWLPVY